MTGISYERELVGKIRSFLNMEKDFLQIITGPRQVGKTTAAMQIAEKWKGKVVRASADQPLPPEPEWIISNWERASLSDEPDVLLILDEIQKVKGWSEVIKGLWDEEVLKKRNRIKVILLGSSALLIQKGVTESLSGRFVLHRCYHWRYPEMKKAFGFSLDEWIFYGGYPGSVPFKGTETWHQYVRDSLIETMISKDVLQLESIAKPSLLRNLFMLGASYPAQIMSYNKMLGQLQDAGNTTTLSHYLKVLGSAFLISGLELYKKGRKVKRGSSPKLILWNNALVSAVSGDSFKSGREDNEWWGRLLENAVGAYFLNEQSAGNYNIYYWRQKDSEVDFVVESQRKLWAVEVKSNKPSGGVSGLKKFRELYPDAKPLIIGRGYIGLEEFFSKGPADFFR